VTVFARNRWHGLPASILALTLGCSSNGAPPDATDAGCDVPGCREWCRSQGSEGGSCAAGDCVCAPGPDASDGAAEAEADARPEGNEADESDAADVAEEADDGTDSLDAACPCGICGPDGGPPELDPDHREGGSPGVVCDRVPIGLNRGVEHYDADSGVVVFIAMDTPPPRWETRKLFVYRTATGDRQRVDDLADLIAAGVDRPQAMYPSLDGDWVAYAAWWTPDWPGGEDCVSSELRLARLSTGEIRVLRRYDSGPGVLNYVGPVALDYPWVGWRETEDRWVVHALNIETDQEYEVTNGTVDVALEGTILATEYGRDIVLFDLESGTDTRLAAGLPGNRWHPALAWPWVIWIDQRDGLWWDDPPPSECIWTSGCCDNDIYGYNRVTGLEVPLVVRRGMQGGEVTAEGEWAAYQDNRDGFDELCREMGCTQIYAFHLTTGREIRITNWPGEYLEPVVYAGRVLFSQMTSYMDYQYDLWDCNLVEP
jgi:hypothetical protein